MTTNERVPNERLIPLLQGEKPAQNRYVAPQAIEATYRESLARLEVQRLQARIAVTTATAALGNAEAELAALEHEFEDWMRSQPKE